MSKDFLFQGISMIALGYKSNLENNLSIHLNLVCKTKNDNNKV